MEHERDVERERESAQLRCRFLEGPHEELEAVHGDLDEYGPAGLGLEWDASLRLRPPFARLDLVTQPAKGAEQDEVRLDVAHTDEADVTADPDLIRRGKVGQGAWCRVERGRGVVRRDVRGRAVAHRCADSAQ